MKLIYFLVFCKIIKGFFTLMIQRNDLEVNTWVIIINWHVITEPRGGEQIQRLHFQKKSAESRLISSLVCHSGGTVLKNENGKWLSWEERERERQTELYRPYLHKQWKTTFRWRALSMHTRCSHASPLGGSVSCLLQQQVHVPKK